MTPTQSLNAALKNLERGMPGLRGLVTADCWSEFQACKMNIEQAINDLAQKETA